MVNLQSKRGPTTGNDQPTIMQYIERGDKCHENADRYLVKNAQRRDASILLEKVKGTVKGTFKTVVE